jgi:hypothetical protein
MPWELTGNGGTNPPGNFLGTTDDRPVVIKTNNTEAVRVNSGAGTSKVEISAQDGLAIAGFEPFITLRDANAGNARSCMQGVNGDIAMIPNSFIGHGAALVVKTGSGNVGIGTSTPSSRVEIVGQDGLAVTGFQPFITLRDANGGNARSCMQGVNGDIAMIPNSFIGHGAAMAIKTGTGNVGIGTSTPNARLHVVGDVFVTGDVRLANADCAEDFDIVHAGLVEPGTVMILGECGGLRQSESAYDRRVAGVVSGAGDFKPGIVLDKQAGADRQPIALLGKVYCKVDAQYGAIEVGDMLTTSATPGHAMRASDPLSAFGAVVGKAMRSFNVGRGLIPILISLQ